MEVPTRCTPAWSPPGSRLDDRRPQLRSDRSRGGFLVDSRCILSITFVCPILTESKEASRFWSNAPRS
jgi:hypothetical protein